MQPVQTLSFLDRKSTRLNSSHDQISYAVFCLKKNITGETTFQTKIKSSAPKKNKNSSWRWRQAGSISVVPSAVIGFIIFLVAAYFFFKDTATPEISPLPQHVALPT